MLLAFPNKLLCDEMYHFALQASPGSWGQLARLGFNEESGEDHFSEFLQAGEALLEEGEHRRAASQVPPRHRLEDPQVLVQAGGALTTGSGDLRRGAGSLVQARVLSRSLWIADSGEVAAVPSSLISILHSNRALERLQLQQWTGAEDDCTVAVTLNPRNAKAWWAGDGGARSRCG